jgi:O-antigen ligase
MYLLKKFPISKSNYLSLLLSLMPLSFIAGNMIININIILLIVSAILIFGKKIFEIEFFFLDKIIILFFILILLTAFVNDYYFYTIKLAWKGYFSTITKSIFFFKYLLLYIILRYLIEKEVIKLKFFFITCSLSSLFVSFDVIYQFLNGKDIFGFKIIGNKLGGPFGDELIAGGYIQKFSIFSFFVIPLFYSKKFSNYLKYLIPILLIIFLIGIILSGNRMPLLMFIFSVFLITVFQKQTRKYFISFSVIFTLTFFLIFNFNSKVNKNFKSFYFQVSEIAILTINNDLNNTKAPPYLKEFLTFYDTWLMHKYIGGGIKNFRWYCHHRAPGMSTKKGFICNMHPHNYYLEILTETGLIGFSLISLFFLLTLYLTFYKKYISRSSLRYNNIIIPFIFLFFIEIFPLKSTGSFFTTGSTTYLFLITGILVGLVRKDILIENKS